MNTKPIKEQHAKVYLSGIAEHASRMEKSINRALADGWTVMHALTFSSGFVLIVFERNDHDKPVNVDCFESEEVQGKNRGLSR